MPQPSSSSSYFEAAPSFMVTLLARLLRPTSWSAAACCLMMATCFSVSHPASSQPVTQPFAFSNVAHNLPHGEHVSTALGDVNGDGLLDVFVSGLFDDIPHAALYLNQGRGGPEPDAPYVFESVESAIPDMAFAAAAWADFDGDGDLDLVASGSRTPNPPYVPVTVLLRNQDGVLISVAHDLIDVFAGDAAWGDVDSDGDLDLVLGGETADGSRITHLYRNENGDFSPIQSLPGIAFGVASWADIDSDADLDLALSGAGDDGFHADVYRNDGGHLIPINAGLSPTAFTTLSWGDIDGDGDLDLLKSGGRLEQNLLEAETQFYRNTGGSLEPFDVEVPDVFSGDVSAADYDNDGDLDLLVMGSNDAFGSRTATIYENGVNDAIEGTFTPRIRLTGTVFGGAVWGDLESDGDIDLIAYGRPTSESPFVNIYENRRQVRPDVSAPEGLEAAPDAQSVTLRWNAVSDASTYNLRVGSRPGGADIATPMADASSGRRLVSQRGNVEMNRATTLHGLTAGTYFWSVQALNPAFAASPFASEQQFTVGTPTSTVDPSAPPPRSTELYPVAPNPSTGPVVIRYALADSGPVHLTIFDVRGRRVATPVNMVQMSGQYDVTWDGRDGSGAAMAPGLYVGALETNRGRYSATFILMR